MTASITVEPGCLRYTLPILHPQDKDMIKYAMSAYGFLLGQGEHTWRDFAAAIAQHYSMDEQRNRAIYDAVLRCHGALAEQEVVAEQTPPHFSHSTRDKPNKRYPFVFVGLWNGSGPQCVTRCKTAAAAKDAARNFFSQHTTGSTKGALLKLLDGSVQCFDSRGDYLFTVPPFPKSAVARK